MAAHQRISAELGIDPGRLPAMRRLWDEGLCNLDWTRLDDDRKHEVCLACPVRALCAQVGKGETGEVWGGSGYTVATCPHGHELTPDNVSYHADGRRHCLACDREHARRTYRAAHGIPLDAPIGGPAATTCRRGHLLTGDNIVVMHKGDGTTFHQCRSCRNLQQRARRAGRTPDEQLAHETKEAAA